MPEIINSNQVNSEPVTAFYVKDGTQMTAPPTIQPPKSKSKLPVIGALILMLVLIVGLAVGLFFINQQQDTRQQASPAGGNCQVCDLNNDGTVSANEVSQLSQCIGAQIGQNDGGFCFDNGQIRDPNADGVLNSADTQFCTECLGAVTNKNSGDDLAGANRPIPTPFCSNNAEVSNRQSQWITDHSQIELSWQLDSGKVSDYEIWNVAYVASDHLGSDKYYLRKLNPQPLPPNTTKFVVTNPNELATRKFLIRAVSSRDQSGALVCYDQWELCQAPVIKDRKVTTTDNINYDFTWVPVQKPHYRYEIWMIGNGTLAELGQAGYYIQKLADITNLNANSARVTIPEELRPKNTNRFLIRAVNYLDKNGQSPCHDEWALGIGQAQSDNACTISFNVASPTITPTSTPGATNTPTPTVTPTSTPGPTAQPTSTPNPSIGCNQVCVTNGDCSNSNHICFTDPEGVNRCRLESNPTNANCQPLVAEQPPVDLPQELPQSGPAEWLTWMKAGLAVLGVGAALLLML